MKHSTSRLTRLVRLALASGLFVPVAQGASDSWIGPTGTQSWATGTNWLSGTAPGATTGVTSADSATFNTTNASSVTIDSGRNVKGISFSAPASGTLGSFTVGSDGVNAANALHLSSGGSIVMDALTAATIRETFNAPLVLEAASGTTPITYSFTNNSVSVMTTANNLLNFAGNISAGTTTSTATLNLTGNGGYSTTTMANTISGVVSDGGAAQGLSISIASTVANQGSWYLTGTNTFTGSVSVNNAYLVVNALQNAGVASNLGAATGTNATITLTNGGRLWVNSTSSTDRAFSISSGQLNITNSGNMVTLNGAVTVGSALVVRGNGNATINGLISGAGSVQHTDGGTLFLTNPNNSFTGDIQISFGGISASSISDKGVVSAIGKGNKITLGQTNAVPVGTFSFTGANGGSSNRDFVIGNGPPNPGTAGGIIENTVAGQTLTLSGTVSTSNAAQPAAVTLQGAGNGILSGSITGTPNLSFTKAGAGTWALNGANTYSGTTTVSGGTLQVGTSGSGQSGTGAVSVSGTGTVLAGTGSVRGAATIGTSSTAGMISPGDSGGSSIGRLSFTDTTSSSLTLATGGVRAQFTLSGASGNAAQLGDDPFDGIQTASLLTGAPPAGTLDSVSVAGTLNLTSGGKIKLTLSGYTPQFGDVFNVFDWAAVNAGTFNVANDLDLSAAPLSTNLSWDTSQFLTDGIVFVVPEPSTPLTLLGGVATLLLTQRGRRTACRKSR